MQPGQCQRFAQEIETVIAWRRSFFPTQATLVTSAEIELVDTSRDRLTVETLAGREQFDIPRLGHHEQAEGLGRRIKSLWEDAEELEYWLETAAGSEIAEKQVAF